MVALQIASGERPTVVGNRHRIVSRLRREISVLEETVDGFEDNLTRLANRASKRFEDRIALGDPAFDAVCGGGVPAQGLTEFQADASRDSGVLSGFIAALLARHFYINKTSLPVLWILPQHLGHEHGRLFANGLLAHGFAANRLLIVRPSRLLDALWICEEAAVTRGLGAVVLDWREPSQLAGLKETRRLHLRAQAMGLPLFFLRHGLGDLAASAPMRRRVEASASAEAVFDIGHAGQHSFPGSIGPPGYALTVSKNKWGSTGNRHILHWNQHERIFFTSKDTGANSGYQPRAATGSGLHAGDGVITEFPTAKDRADHRKQRAG